MTPPPPPPALLATVTRYVALKTWVFSRRRRTLRPVAEVSL